MCSIAALNGHLEVLKWARGNGCPWNKQTCSYAAINGDLEVLKYARENSCPWDKDVCVNAFKNNHFELLKWALINGCEWDGRRKFRELEINKTELEQERDKLNIKIAQLYEKEKRLAECMDIKQSGLFNLRI